MFGLALIAISSLFTEATESIGKKEVQNRVESIYSMGFLQLVASIVILGATALIYRSSFYFSLASLPTFTARVILELVLTYLTLTAIVKADRTTFTSIRVGTIPLLLVSDWLLHYSLSLGQIIGIGVITLTLIGAFVNKALKRAGLGYVVGSTLLASATIALYKFNIENYNSVVAEQLIITTLIAGLLFFVSLWRRQENPFALLKRPIIIGQSLSTGISGVIESFAYTFAPASIILAAKRSFGVLWSLISGHLYFKEQKLTAKLAIFVLLVVSLVLLAV